MNRAPGEVGKYIAVVVETLGAITVVAGVRANTGESKLGTEVDVILLDAFNQSVLMLSVALQ